MQRLMVHAQQSYPIDFARSLFNSSILAEESQKMASQIVVISDDTVAHYYADAMIKNLQTSNRPVHLLTFPPGEHYKTRATKERLEDEMFAHLCTRDTLVIALGGGIVTDVAGYVAATYCRGVPAIYVPTTLLAMVDASIGGKTGVNTARGKNLIGTFTQPAHVYMDVDFLDTLPKVEFNTGMVELIKHALIADKNLFTQIERNLVTLQDKDYLQAMIYRSCEIKRDIVEQDPEEKNIRQLLNFGHTVGHVLEALSDYEIRHGEAVALGMIAECYLSTQMGLLNPKATEILTQLLLSYGLPLTLPANFSPQQALAYFSLDKKNTNQQVRCVLLKDLGVPFVENGQYSQVISPELLVQTMEWLVAWKPV